ncbi:MAG TPA: helix-turn-helix domain-containing protein [Candidatus Sulfotelmatobacter sp.]|nr:helix-turn-helix domain-containing protein [Candidatus Sulfotelmatobacter sp.]
MKKRAAPSSSPCAISGLLELLTRPWTLHVLWVLGQSGPLRFSVLKKSVDGISARVLTERLRTLEDAGFVFRHYEATIPPTVTYGITERMQDIEKVFQQLEAVARKWQAAGRTPVEAAAARASSTVQTAR